LTEAEWNRCTSPEDMLQFVRATGKASDRKLRLFAVACCRRVWDLIRPEACRQGLETAERFAEGLAGPQQLGAAYAAADEAFFYLRMDTAYSEDAAYAAAQAAARPLAVDEVCRAVATATAYSAGSARSRVAGVPGEAAAYEQAEAAADAMLARLLRCMFGPLAFRPVALAPALLAWHDGTLGRLAQAAYEYRNVPQGTLDNGRLAVLADALEEAGLDNQEVLRHLREQGKEHYRGCWCVDLVLNKG
jgi:hypothetical protein